MEDNGLPSLQRFVTDHNDEGKAIFHNSVEEKLPFQAIGGIAQFGLGYVTNEFPVDLSNDADVNTYKHYQQNAPGITIPGGTVLRIVDMAPGATSPVSCPKGTLSRAPFLCRHFHLKLSVLP